MSNNPHIGGDVLEFLETYVPTLSEPELHVWVITRYVYQDSCCKYVHTLLAAFSDEKTARERFELFEDHPNGDIYYDIEKVWFNPQWSQKV